MEWDWLQPLHSGDWAELTQCSLPGEFRKKRLAGNFSVEALTAYCSQIPRQLEAVKSELQALNSKASCTSDLPQLHHSIDFRCQTCISLIVSNHCYCHQQLLRFLLSDSQWVVFLENLSLWLCQGTKKSPQTPGLTSSSHYKTRKGKWDKLAKTNPFIPLKTCLKS